MASKFQRITNEAHSEAMGGEIYNALINFYDAREQVSGQANMAAAQAKGSGDAAQEKFLLENAKQSIEQMANETLAQIRPVLNRILQGVSPSEIARNADTNVVYALAHTILNHQEGGALEGFKSQEIVAISIAHFAEYFQQYSPKLNEAPYIYEKELLPGVHGPLAADDLGNVANLINKGELTAEKVRELSNKSFRCDGSFTKFHPETKDPLLSFTVFSSRSADSFSQAARRVIYMTDHNKGTVTIFGTDPQIVTVSTPTAFHEIQVLQIVDHNITSPFANEGNGQFGLRDHFIKLNSIYVGITGNEANEYLTLAQGKEAPALDMKLNHLALGGACSICPSKLGGTCGVVDNPEAFEQHLAGKTK